MHEYSIVASLLAHVQVEAARAGASRVHRLTVRVGELAGVDVELLKRAFEIFRARTVAEAAELAVTHVRARWGCPGCGQAILPGERLRCPRCSTPARLLEGDELVLERLELEVPDV